ncbi:MAG: hypothetical protein R3E73_12710 [Porticoccaceae bacterium]
MSDQQIGSRVERSTAQFKLGHLWLMTNAFCARPKRSIRKAFPTDHGRSPWQGRLLATTQASRLMAIDA